MKISYSIRENNVSSTFPLAGRCFSPLTGLGVQIGSFLQGRSDSPLICLGAQLTGVHYLLDRPEPKSSYHVGGSGLLEFEAFIKCIAETGERYSQLVSGIENEHLIGFTTYDELKASHGDELLDLSCFDFFTPAQLSQPGFPFRSFGSASKYGFIRLESLIGGWHRWVPVQLVLLGYNVRDRKGEQRILSAVTTGTATHTHRVKCLKNAILELIQIDSAMGNWYGHSRSTRIVLDERTKNLSSILSKTLSDKSYEAGFYLLPNPDLAGFTIACLIDNGHRIPSMVVGLGCCTSLESAMYKAFIEAVSCHQLARVISFKELFPENGIKREARIDTSNIADLDTNVFYYSLPQNRISLLERFDTGVTMSASEAPRDMEGSEQHQTKMLIDSFRTSGKELLFLDLTAHEVSELGMVTYRIWSPDMLSLSIPSFPTLAHKRYNDYGNIQHTGVHPLP